jgi:hypothetical protein
MVLYLSLSYTSYSLQSSTPNTRMQVVFNLSMEHERHFHGKSHAVMLIQQEGDEEYKIRVVEDWIFGYCHHLPLLVACVAIGIQQRFSRCD